MGVAGWTQIALLLVALTALTPWLGGFMARLYQGERVAGSLPLRPVERVVYRSLRVEPDERQHWTQYARSLLLFSVASWLILYLVLRTQGVHPFNPQKFAAGPWDLSFNTASSFVSNTSWQYYTGSHSRTSRAAS